jgi:hypothetical protein
MKLCVVRDIGTADYTHGRLYVDGRLECFTLEDCDRRVEAGGKKVYGLTAIPLGTYSVVLDKSQRFGRIMPRLLDVQQFLGIRIHPGNTSQDTEGCLLVGRGRGRDRVTDSRGAYATLMDKLTDAVARGESITITIERTM